MQRTLTLEREISVFHETESFCLVCETNLNSSSSTNIFYSSLPRYGELLASFVLRVLRPVASDLRSSYICARCHDLFRMLEQAQWTVSNVRSEILKVYHSRETTNEAQRCKVEISSGRLLPEDDMFVEEPSEEEKNIVDEDSFIDIAQLRSLDVERNEFDSLNIVIDNLETSCIGSKTVVEDPLALREPDKYKIDNLKVEARAEKSNPPEDATRNPPEGASEIVENITNISAKNSIVRHCGIDEPENRVGRFNEISTNLLKNSLSDEGANCVDRINEISAELLKNSVREEREIISQISDELQKTSTTHECLRIDESADAREIIDDITSSMVQNFDSISEKKSLYTLQCNLCSRLFKTSKDLQSHCLKHGGSRPYRCRKCDERFAEFSRANCHSSAVHSSTKNCIAVSREPAENETVDFSNDDWIFPDDIGKDELERLTGSEEFRTKEMENFTGSADVVEAKSNEKIEKPSWKSGRVSKYSLQPLKHSCSTCGKKWRTSAELKTHVKSHSNLRPYMCEKCGQAYKHKHALEIHVGMHNGISPFQCSVCNKCFTQKGALMRHLPMHTGETPYQCELCGKRFVHHTSYNMHALSHTGKKSYRCHVCDLSLLSTSHLKRHMRVHTGEKPYSCALCGKSFAERYNLFAHQKIHDPVEIMAKAAKKMTYKCERCDEYFDKKQKLDEHAKDRHGNNCNSSNEPANGRKWIGHTVEVDTTTRGNDNLVEQSWHDLDYEKFQSAGIKAAQSDDRLNELSHESIAMLMSQSNYNKGMAVVVQSTDSTINTGIDQTQI